MIIAFDLDGTLADIAHRLPYIERTPKDWRGFFAACGNDAPIGRIIEVERALMNAGHTIEIWTGRSAEVQLQTKQWLARQHILFDQLRMRRAGDHRADHVVKAEWYDNLPRAERPVMAFEDRAQVVDMWRARAVLCCQVAPGDF